MATLTALKFNDPLQADQVLGTLKGLQAQQLIQIQDAAIVRWPAGAKKPKTEQLSGLTAIAGLSGAFWGLLFGLLFFIPFLGMAVGAAFGALAGHFADVGIDDNFINQVKSQVTPGTSALFLLSSGAVVERVAEALQGVEFEVIATNLSQEQEAKLMEMFTEG
ncbi:MAG TPA: DUF1269 domain-containing protein [Thermomicrobiales bacterium]|nr:DUF1269 domain-containing protein [Thermomicrobiales bacterium]